MKTGTEHRYRLGYRFFNVFNLHHTRKESISYCTRVHTVSNCVPFPLYSPSQVPPLHSGCLQSDTSRRNCTTVRREAHWMLSPRGLAAGILASLGSLWRRRCPWNASCTRCSSLSALQPATVRVEIVSEKQDAYVQRTALKAI